jgi:hypothetical protein
MQTLHDFVRAIAEALDDWLVGHDGPHDLGLIYAAEYLSLACGLLGLILGLWIAP